MEIFKKGLCFESERTTHQNIVEYGRADKRNIYWKKVNCEQVLQYRGENIAGTKDKRLKR